MAKDQIGLQQIWPRPGATIATSYDLVVVHGLAGGPISTWTHENGSFWLDWLPSDIPGIRIFVFGYEAQAVYFRSKETNHNDSSLIFRFAETLCFDMNNSRFKQKNPITFLGHGVGGIIVKKALTYCNSRKDLYGEILSSTRHILFLDTPHGGLNTQNWKAIYGQVASRNAEEQFNIWSTALGQLARGFTEIGNHVHITEVHATIHSMIRGERVEAVNEASATINANFEHHVHLDNTSHLTMCKFDNRDDPNYNRLMLRIKNEFEANAIKRAGTGSSFGSQELKRQETQKQLQEIRDQIAKGDARVEKVQTDQSLLVANAARSEQERESEIQMKLKKKIKKWLRPPDIKKITYKADLASRLNAAEGTCHWLLDDKRYESWRSSENSSIAWLHGIQGSGKSTLVAYTINHMQSKGEKIAYLFCHQDASISAAVRINCLTIQLIKKNPAILQVLKPKYEKTAGASLTALSTATMIFEEALKAFGACFIFIDALDECEPKDRQAMVRALLDTVQKIPSGLKILCSSRNEPDLELMLRPHHLTTDIEITRDNIKPDITKMLQTDISETVYLSRRLASDNTPPGFIDFVVTKLANGAQGMFLLPKLMIEDLDSKGTIEEISAFLENLPAGLHEYYMTILDKMDVRWYPMAKRVFTWVAWAKRPLSLAELQEVFSIDGEHYPDLAIDIKGACGCLISIEDEEIRLSHSSVKRFLIESQQFKDSSLYRQLIITDPDDHLADICTRYLFNGEYDRPRIQIQRFSGRNPQTLKDCCPFLKYAALYWIWHCCASKTRLHFIRRIHGFVFSNQLIEWCEAVNHFLSPETESFKYLCTVLQTFVVELKYIRTLSKLQLDMLEQISMLLSKLRGFWELWGDVLSNWPQEIRTLKPLIDHPNRSVGFGRQDTLLTGARFLTAPEKAHDMLEKSTADQRFDRFVLADLNIFSWRSLMPSSAWDKAYKVPLNPDEPAVIYLRTGSILTGHAEEAYGLDPAAIGLMQATTVLRKDLRAIAITWARFSKNRDEALNIKTYVWLLSEGIADVNLQRIDWTDVDDPYRADLTISNAFKKSKGAVAFSSESKGEYLWTAGGKYDIRTGLRIPGPALFYDSEMSSLTFASNASIIAGTRNGKRLEVYDIPKFRLVTFAEGDCTLLGISPCGNFVLFIRRIKRNDSGSTEDKRPEGLEHRAGMRGTYQEICLLTREKCLHVWSYGDKAKADDEIIDLEYFYNNGGLHSFSENETILVICLPMEPEWSLMAYELENNDALGTSWKVEYSSLLMGANIMSFALCSIHERRLYLLDSYGITRIIEIARKAVSTTAVSTVRADDRPPILSAVLETDVSQTLVTATLSQSKLVVKVNGNLKEVQQIPNSPTLVPKFWDLNSLGKITSSLRSLSFLRDMLTIESQTLIVDFEPIPGVARTMARTNFCQSQNWTRIGIGAQRAIQDTLDGLAESHEHLDMSAEAGLRDMTPRISTRATFNSLATLGFFQSVIQYPLPSKDGQPFWSLTMIMDIRSLDYHKARKTGSWVFMKSGTVQEEYLACSYHEERKLLAYSVCMEWMDKSEETPRWFGARLCLAYIGVQEWDIDPDPRGTFITTKSYDLAYGKITSWLFSNCGRYLFGMSVQWPSRVIQFDTCTGETIRTIYDPFYAGGISTMSLAIHGNDVFAAGTTGGAIVLTRLPLTPNSKYETRTLAVAPFGIQDCEKLRLLFPSSSEQRLVIVGQGVNYLRKDGKTGGNLQWPIVVSVKEQDMTDWVELAEQKEPDPANTGEEPATGDADAEEAANEVKTSTDSIPEKRSSESQDPKISKEQDKQVEEVDVVTGVEETLKDQNSSVQPEILSQDRPEDAENENKKADCGLENQNIQTTENSTDTTPQKTDLLDNETNSALDKSRTIAKDDAPGLGTKPKNNEAKSKLETKPLDVKRSEDDSDFNLKQRQEIENNHQDKLQVEWALTASNESVQNAEKKLADLSLKFDNESHQDDAVAHKASEKHDRDVTTSGDNEVARLETTETIKNAKPRTRPEYNNTNRIRALEFACVIIFSCVIYFWLGR